MPLLRSLGVCRAGFYKDVAPLALGKVGHSGRAAAVNQDASVPTGGSQRTASPTHRAKRPDCVWL
jgi:hypothetical protein